MGELDRHDGMTKQVNASDLALMTDDPIVC